MKVIRVILLVCGVAAALIYVTVKSRTADQEAETNGFSINLDLSDVEPVMELVCRQVESGFSEAEASKVVALAKRLEVGEERGLDFAVTYEGKSGNLRVQMFMDDVDAPDVRFLSDIPELVSMVENAIVKYMEDLGR
jgi:hypothetical protein